MEQNLENFILQSPLRDTTHLCFHPNTGTLPVILSASHRGLIFLFCLNGKKMSLFAPHFCWEELQMVWVLSTFNSESLLPLQRARLSCSGNFDMILLKGH